MKLQQRIDEAEGFVQRCQALGLRTIEDVEKISSLQQKTSGGIGSEEDAQDLQARRSSRPLRSTNYSNVGTREYMQLQNRLASLENDYGKLAMARNTLEARCRYYKDLTKDWRAYVRAWESRHGESLTPKDFVEGVLGNKSAIAGEHQNFPIEPPPPIYRGDMFLPSKSPSTPTALNSPQEANTGSRPPEKHCRLSSTGFHEPTGAISKHEALTQDIHLLPTTNRPIKSMHTSEHSRRQVETASHVKNQTTQTPGEPEAAAGLAEGDADTPVVVSERSLKRKRVQPMVNDDLEIHQRDLRGIGSAEKPLSIKSEQGSSSPAVPGLGGRLGGLDDSLDLDDVGDRLLTPRKRRRLELQHMKFSMLKASTTAETGEVLLDYALDDADPKINDVALNNVPEGEDEQRSEESPLHDKGFYMRKGEEHGLKLWQEEQRKSAEVQKQTELDAKVPEWLRGSKNKIRALQFLQNERTGNRRARIDADQQVILDRTDTQSNAPGISEFKFPLALQEGPISELSHKSGAQRGLDGRKMEVNKPAILRFKDSNCQILPRTSEHLANQKRPRPFDRHNHGAAAVPSIAEDGENLEAVNKIRRIPRSPESTTVNTAEIDGGTEKTPKMPGAHHRLGDLLAKPSSESAPLTTKDVASRLAKSSGATRTPPARTMKSNDVETPANQRANSARSTRANSTVDKPATTTRNKLSTSATKIPPCQPPRANSPPTTLPSHEPLRARPVRRLRAEDFKPNPAANQGRDYAFSEVVRTRDQRQCLPGCDKPHCCGGQLRKMVQIGGYTPTRKSPLFPPSSQDPSADDEDHRILKDYLGSSYSSARIKRMGEEERQELLLQAKTKLFADEYGRHRQAYGRAPTPPGFWRTDMPSTQEEEEDRKQAWCLERVRVEEMYREAVRGRGRWIFRDE